MKDHQYLVSLNGIIAVALIYLCLSCASKKDTLPAATANNPLERYQALQDSMLQGWNTWNSHSMLSHVKMPQGFAVNLGLKNTKLSHNQYLNQAFPSAKVSRPEKVEPGLHAYDGSYTDLVVEWEGSRLRVESATDDNGDLYLLVTPLKLPGRKPYLFLQGGILWNKSGTVQMIDQMMEFNSGSETIAVYLSSENELQGNPLPLLSPYLSLELNDTIGFSSGQKRSLSAIRENIQAERAELLQQIEQYGELAETYQAMQSVMAWNTIYDPYQQRVMTPVSRIWNDFFGGVVLFDWDTYFAALMASLDNKGLAYANAAAITRSITEAGFIPNYAGPYNLGSPDRSQPPVGSYVVHKIYQRFPERWFLELLYDQLLSWNRWWISNRMNQGFLSWGSNPLPPPYDDDAANHWQGAAYESGLDNSPMYDEVPFNQEKHVLELPDVGLMSLYIWDCQNLGRIAEILNKQQDQQELEARARELGAKLQELWSEEKGIYLNYRTDTRQFSDRISPTNLYPLHTGIPTQEQAQRMVQDYLLNPQHFAGEWMIPSISRSDPAYLDQNYWRGRIWGPMNLLVYLGLERYELEEASQLLADKSRELLMKNYRQGGYVYENFNAISGKGRMPEEHIGASDSYYHWGALLGYIAILEARE
jgi:hypothetical protein